MAKGKLELDAAAVVAQEDGIQGAPEAAATVAFRWTGSRIWQRVIEPYIWKASNNFTQEVDLDMAAALLTYPIKGEFVPVEGQSFSENTLQQLAEKMGGDVSEVKGLLGIKAE